LARLHGHALGDLPVNVIPAGEESKTWDAAGGVVRWLAEAGADRKASVAAFGGGVIGDLAGFAAASYMRGVSLIQVPTTLLAMVDSAIGGKTGVDLPEGKNLAGAFWPAKEITVVPKLLKTLPKREWLNGSAEIWKYGAILDAELFAELEKHPISQDIDQTEPIIRRCIELKAQTVEADEFETTGLRAILNFGHTIGHAIEWAQNYKGLAHGEAVSVGMILEAELGEQIGTTEKGTASRIRLAMAHQGLPTRLPDGLEAKNLISAMRRDKKAESGRLAFSLLDRIGACKLVKDVPEDEVLAVLNGS
jgi:3-dehydroquinate synthase